MLRPLVAAALALVLTGCRVHVDHVRDGVTPVAQAILRLEPGKSRLDDALAALGAPDGVEWVDQDDVLLYSSFTVRSSHWEAENPYWYVTGGVSPTTLVGEVPGYFMFVNAKSGSPAPVRPPQGPGAMIPVPRFSLTSKPLTLNGDARGQEQVRLFFDRESQILQRIEVAHGTPGGGVGGVAQGTFLK